MFHGFSMSTIREPLKTPYYANIEQDTISNQAYRSVQYTDSRLQVVLMSLKPGEEIGLESHPYTSQFFRVEEGSGLAFIGGVYHILDSGTALVVPPGQDHNIINTSSTRNLHLYTIYSPPQHPSSTLQLNKVD